MSAVDAADKTGPSSAFGRKASVMHRNVPSKADIRGSIPLAFCIGVNLGQGCRGKPGLRT